MPHDETARPPDNPWDRLSDYFDTSKEKGEIPAGAADNILVAWPVFFRFIEAHVPVLRGTRVLDYGCGAGSFAHRLRAYGCHVTGIDPSAAMIAKARRAYGDAADFRVGDAALLRGLPPFALITSIMALQFVADIAPLLAAFAAALAAGGHLIFAVHNPAYHSGETLRFSNGVAVPIFIRSAEEYNAIAARAGFAPLLEEYPPFTEEFIARYPTYAGRIAPEYLILGYRKR
jgi:SAM-dependent methyltransferase